MARQQAEAAGLEVGDEPAHESDFQAQEAVERMIVPMQGMHTGWYFRQGNLKTICLERQVGQAAKPGARNSLRRSHNNHCDNINTQVLCRALHSPSHLFFLQPGGYDCPHLTDKETEAQRN